MKASAEPEKVVGILSKVDGVYIERQDKYEVFPIEKFEIKNAVRCPKGFVFIGDFCKCPSMCCEICRDERAVDCELGKILPIMQGCDCKELSFDCPKVNSVLAIRRINGKFEKQKVLILKTEL